MTADVEALFKKARDNRAAAELLLQNNYPEIAAARVYYALFYAAEALLLARGLTFSSHAAVIAAYGREFAKTGAMDARFHRYLIDAQDLRQSGDYDIGMAVTVEQVEQALQWAQEFIAEAEAYLTGPGGV